MEPFFVTLIERQKNTNPTEGRSHYALETSTRPRRGLRSAHENLHAGIFSTGVSSRYAASAAMSDGIAHSTPPVFYQAGMGGSCLVCVGCEGWWVRFWWEMGWG